MLDPASLNGLIRPTYEGRPCILAGSVAAAWPRMIAQLRSLGAAPFLVIAGNAGTGPQPEGDDIEIILVDLGDTAGDMMREFRAWERLGEAPPGDLAATIGAFDPDRRARVLVPGPVAMARLGDRSIHGHRRPAWVALEDKTLVDALFDRCDVDRPPSAVVPVGEAVAAAGALDHGLGTVWSGDARSGFNGGTARVRWVRNPDEAIAASSFFAEDHDHVRVAPFLEGVPCSIHGLVSASQVAALRPCEMVILRSPERGLVYAGTSTSWEPAPADRKAMGDVVRRVGALLRTEAGFRGPFTVDGIMTADGFRPTEVNPREGSALGYVSQALPDLALSLLSRALIEGDDLGLDLLDLGALIVEATETERTCGAWTFNDHPSTETREWGLIRAGDDWRIVDLETEDLDGRVLVGPSPLGSMVGVTPVASRIPIGPPFAPLAASAFRAIDRKLDLGLGPLEPAQSVR